MNVYLFCLSCLNQSDRQFESHKLFFNRSYIFCEVVVCHKCNCFIRILTLIFQPKVYILTILLTIYFIKTC